MEKREDLLVSKELARDHAITRMLLGILTETPRLEKWKGATIGPEPIEIFDLNGQLLFYEFSVQKNREIVGRIKVSANKVLGPAVYTAEIGPRRWDLEKAKQQVKKIAEEKFKGTIVASTRLICYSYPKLGILAVLVEPKTKEEIRVIMDVATYGLVPLIFAEEGQLGLATWSLYGSIPEKEKVDRISRWQDDNRLLEFLKEKAKQARIDLREKLSDQELQKLRSFFQKELSIAIWPPPPKIITLNLNGQEDPDWCACATGQMILRHHHYYYEQNDIAQAMGTIPPAPSPPPFYPRGTTYGGFMSGMESLSRNYLKAAKDDTPTWAETVSEIDQGRPLMSCIPHHARACAGYTSKLKIMYPIDNYGMLFHVLKFLYIYDPWPPNANNSFCNPQGGSEYWEDWDATTYWSFVYLRPCAGTMICQE